jgi:GT2 family glycosyltransferase
VLLRWARPALDALAAAPLPGDDADRRARVARRARFARGLGLPRLPITEQDRAGVPAPPPDERPAISVIVPFAGTRAEADAVCDALTAIERRPGDELIVADNSVDPVMEPRGDVRVVRADKERSSYSARNAAAASATGQWLLFTDSDCVPAPWLLDAYWAPPPADETGAVAGSIVNPPPHGWADRYSADADVLSQARSLNHPYKPYGVTANLLVRRAAWEQAGGFAEGARSGGDAEFCWRIQHRGWAIEHRPHAAVIHFHRTTLNGILRQYRRYGAGVAWLERRYPGATHGWPALPPHWLRGPLIDLVAARPRAAAKRAIDVLCVLAAVRGSREPNRPPPWPTP